MYIILNLIDLPSISIFEESLDIILVRGSVTIIT